MTLPNIAKHPSLVEAARSQSKILSKRRNEKRRRRSSPASFAIRLLPCCKLLLLLFKAQCFAAIATWQKTSWKQRPSSQRRRQWRSLEYYLLSNNPIITQNFSNALRFYDSTTSQIYYIILYYYYHVLLLLYYYSILWCLLLYTMDDGWDKAKHTTPIYHRISYHLIHQQPPNKAEKRISFSTHPTHMFLLLRSSSVVNKVNADAAASSTQLLWEKGILASSSSSPSQGSIRKLYHFGSPITTSKLYKLLPFKELQKSQRVCHRQCLIEEAASALISLSFLAGLRIIPEMTGGLCKPVRWN